jgi:hypothetical protein
MMKKGLTANLIDVPVTEHKKLYFIIVKSLKVDDDDDDDIYLEFRHSTDKPVTGSRSCHKMTSLVVTTTC